jgi:hypothetical protein
LEVSHQHAFLLNVYNSSEFFPALVTDDPGSKPDWKYARWRDRQNYIGRIKYNLGL